MKRLIYIIGAFMLMLIFIVCCATMPPDQGRGYYDMRSSVGNAPFVGESSYMAKDLAHWQTYGY